MEELLSLDWRWGRPRRSLARALLRLSHGVGEARASGRCGRSGAEGLRVARAAVVWCGLIFELPGSQAAPSAPEHQLGRVFASPTEWGRREHPAVEAGAQRRGLCVAILRCVVGPHLLDSSSQAALSVPDLRSATFPPPAVAVRLPRRWRSGPQGPRRPRWPAASCPSGRAGAGCPGPCRCSRSAGRRLPAYRPRPNRPRGRQSLVPSSRQAGVRPPRARSWHGG